MLDYILYWIFGYVVTYYLYKMNIIVDVEELVMLNIGCAFIPTLTAIIITFLIQLPILGIGAGVFIHLDAFYDIFRNTYSMSVSTSRFNCILIFLLMILFCVGLSWAIKVLLIKIGVGNDIKEREPKTNYFIVVINFVINALIAIIPTIAVALIISEVLKTISLPYIITRNNIFRFLIEGVTIIVMYVIFIHFVALLRKKISERGKNKIEK